MSTARRKKPPTHEERAKEATEAAVSSTERVVEHARKVCDSLTQRAKRAQTEPIGVPEFVDEEDSLVTSIEHVIAVSTK